MANTNKISKNIRIGKVLFGKIIFRPGDHSINWIRRVVLSNFEKLNKFYKVNNLKVNFELIYSRKEFDDKIGRKTQKWMVGVALKNKIYLFSPLVIEKISPHKKSKLDKIIAHELCHILNIKINKEVLNWIDEGTALFLSHQKKAKDFKKSDWCFFIENFLDRNINLRSFAKHEGYKISYWLVRIIVEKFGINKLLELIKINPKKYSIKNEIEKVLAISFENFLEILDF